MAVTNGKISVFRRSSLLSRDSSKKTRLSCYLGLTLVALLLLDPQRLVFSGATPVMTSAAHTSTSYSSAAFLSSRQQKPRAHPLVTLSSGEYDNTDQSEPSSRDSDRNGDDEESTTADRSFNLEDCARLLTTTAPPDSGVTGSRTPGGGGFAIRIAGTPTKYVHGESYTGKCRWLVLLARSKVHTPLRLKQRNIWSKS